MLSDEQRFDFRGKVFDFIDKTCIFRPDPDIEYTPGVPKGHVPGNGTNDTFLFHLRRLTHNPVMSYYASLLILDDIVQKVKMGDEKEFFQLCGLETASIPFMTAIQGAALKFGLSINAFSIRKERKPSGLFHLVDGLPTEAPVIILDDLINSGRSIRYCMDVCEYELGLEVRPHTFSIVTLAKEPFHFIHNKKTMQINSIFVKDDFDYKFDPNKYWLPRECSKTTITRPEYF